MENRSEKMREILSQALEKADPKERCEFLDEACGEDQNLRDKMKALIALRSQVGDFLESPPFLDQLPLDNLPEEPLGTFISRYKLLEKIGEGGMAVVYMAEQERPIRRKVALKIIKLGMDTKSVIARFEAERQALAMMDHPNIARILDAGATETGRPYFVMDLVPGAPITEYCDQNRLSIQERLNLFISVCSAVQHAHQKGIIHRDVKPSNIMVTMHNGQPIPKVIDFGIAKATNQKLTEKTLFTRYAHIIGTPAYMSPEQAELSDLDVDTRTDIYSLGVLLYELLTGTTPFSEEKLREAGYLQMQKIICEEEPTKPSTKISTLGKALTDVAKWHSCSPEALPKLVRGDLDWIVLKSLEKDRTHRYDTASALGLDIERHLDNKPVLARAPSPMYRLQKFLRRNRSQTISSLTIAILSAVVMIILSIWNQNRLELAQAEFFVDTGILSQAHESFAMADYPKALERVKSILNSKHVGPEARLLYASILVEGQQPGDAMTKLEDLLYEKSEIAGAAYSLLARILWESESSDDEKLKKIDEYHRKAEELLPETAEAYFLRAMTALTIKEKLDLLDEALELDLRHYESHRLRAFTYYASRRYEEMEHDALVMRVLQPNDPLGYSLRAIALCELGNYEDAIKEYDNAIGHTSAESTQLTEFYAQRSGIYLRMGEYEQAIADANEGLTLFPSGTILHFRIFCALIALGKYEEASALYHRITASDIDSKRSFRDWSMKYVFDTLEANRSWHPTVSEPEGVAFLVMQEAEDTYHQYIVKGGRRLIINGFSASWSPDGKEMVLSLGIPGHSGIATFDPSSQEIDLLIAPGKDPKWSPDGQFIAFVRDCQILSLPELVTAEQSSIFRSYRGEEIWIMNADGTAPRRLAQGRWPSWGRDSKHLYYQWVGFGPHRISIEDSDAESELILKYGWDHCSVSPDQTYTAGADRGDLEIHDIASRSLFASWAGPGRMWGGNWHPGGHEFSMGGTDNTEDRTGLWIYDLAEGRAEKVFSGQVTSASWAPDGAEMAITLGSPYHEIWIASLDPNSSTIEVLGPGKTLEGHYQEMVNYYTRIIESDPAHAESYRLRAKYYDYLGEKKEARADIHSYEAVLDSSAQRSEQDRWIQDLLIGLLHSVPENLGPPLTSRYHEGAATLSTDGLSLYFGSNRPGGEGKDDLLKSIRATTKDNWGTPVNLGPAINSPDKDTHPSISDDGLSLYFRSLRPGGLGDSDLWVSTRVSISDSWSKPVNLGPTVNSSAHDSCPNISSDGLSLFFNSTRPGGYGSYDIWVTTRRSTQEEWGKPVNLGPKVNSTDLDGGPHISADGRTLFFHSYRPGGYGWIDLWVTRKETAGGPWSEPVNLGPTINGQAGDATPFVSADGSTFFFASNRPEGHGGWDIWQVPIRTYLSSQGDDNFSSLNATKDDDGKGG